jgi:cytochrome d ubiquinol oxidase subunit II
MYVVMDGSDLGVGMLFALAPGDADRDAMMGSIAPFWDGNETWLVLGGTLLIAAFPLAYATLLPAFYVPLMVMLFALVFRGVAFEYRFRAGRFRRAWDRAFSGGSALASFCQGLMLGAFVDGVPVRDGAFAGGTADFLGAFAVACGLGLMAGYGLLGATWLIYKTEGTTNGYGRRAARLALPATLGFIALISAWTPLAHPNIARRWFGWPGVAFLWSVPVATALVAHGVRRTIAGPHEARPFLLAVGLFLLGFLGLGVSLWPFAVPYAASLWQAASSPATQAFVGVGTAVVVPIVLGYLGFAFWVFRGKTKAGGGYGE